MNRQLANVDKPDLQVVSEFDIDGVNYLVVILADCEHVPAPQTEVARFEVRGQGFAVVRASASERGLALDRVLTERETQIASLVALGHPNKQIAHRLTISEWTVSTHLRRIFAKLGVDSRAAMVYRCAALLQQP
ncbi:helix-turn-helix transcriptional regulator [Candidatus Cyanaurora vandensis]|uniref:helix-turn-helix domain-containing protein n=1 Tax=Candidatus Cyanaurora vandensis TaxID=2714958 RepID=UPI002579B11C|nr:helix-turn-helix transcriptional regulator [Candidatus Cyanaurora vandensis]